MSSITKISMPKQVKFGKAFDVTLEYTTDDAQGVTVTVDDDVSVKTSPRNVEVEENQTSVDFSITLTDKQKPSTKRIVLVDFALDDGTSDTASTTVSP